MQSRNMLVATIVMLHLQAAYIYHDMTQPVSTAGELVVGGCESCVIFIRERPRTPMAPVMQQTANRPHLWTALDQGGALA